MDTLSAFAMGQANLGKPLMVFDWVKAAKLIKESRAKTASTGFRGDWEWTGGGIWDGKPVKSGWTYLASTWATPELCLDGGEHIECFIMESETDWDCDTEWPEEALKIIEEKGE